MNFQICGLDHGQFSHLFGKSTQDLAEYGVQRMTVDEKPGFPCRVSLQDVDIGKTVLLLNYEHQSAESPYRSSHAIFIQEWAKQANIGKNQIPEMLRVRLISVRAFDASGMMVNADIVDGSQLEGMIDRMFSIESVSYLHLHNAKRGCFAARVERA
ncbi:MAG: DUF1203 domain-containing protein [Gammaproteobacteria bacterium]|nr:DUF1203 domain-containing protein [Gammaproteobacteria bacterium]MDH3373055.1 DUF1203 domain-containing protein [Gammaproteobacteria bacterium]MDH3408935.1 DUF1203 domain-containing protein [Gammaproteobacteria bacterium]